MRKALLLASACAVVTTQATLWQLDFGPKSGGFGLNNANERPASPNPPGPSPATGEEIQDYETGDPQTLFMTYDDVDNRIELHFGWGSVSEVEQTTGTPGTPLSSQFTAMHIHGPADQENSAGILYNLVTTPSERALDGLVLSNNGRNGLFDTVFTLVPNPNGTTFSVQEQEDQLLGGLWYINIHSQDYPGGEIRGQLIAIPEPHHYAMMAGLGLLGFAGYRRFKTARA